MTGPCGTVGGYRAHVRYGSPTCLPCRGANADWQRGYRARMYLAGGPMVVDATGTQRRLRALALNGWNFGALGERLGVVDSAVRAWSANAKVRRDTAARVAVLFDELWDQPGPSVRAAGYARRKGWLPALAWDDIDDPAATPATADDDDAVDDLAVEAVLDGYRLDLTGVTAHAAVHALAARDYPPPLIAFRCGLTERQVHRLKARDTAPHRKTNRPYMEEAS